MSPSPLAAIIENTPEATFEQAGGFDFTDELALALDNYWRKQKVGHAVVSRMTLEWLLEGYARARLAAMKP